jgi:hypothetical protein
MFLQSGHGKGNAVRNYMVPVDPSVWYEHFFALDLWVVQGRDGEDGNQWAGARRTELLLGGGSFEDRLGLGAKGL